MSVPKKVLALSCLWSFYLLIFCFSFGISERYTGGDQALYSEFYTAVQGASLIDVGKIQIITTGSVEPLYGMYAWVGANLEIQKSVWFSLANVALFIAALKYINAIGVTIYLYPLVLTNFYLFVFAFSAERLKLGVITLIWCVLIRGKAKYLLALAGPLFHFQIFLFYVLPFARKLKYFVIGLMRGSLKIYALALMAAAFFMAFAFLGLFANTIQAKLTYYSSGNLGDFLGVFFFGVVYVAYGGDRFSGAVTFFALGVLALVLGEGRINLVAFLIAIGPTLNYNRGKNLASMVLLSYFSVKGMFFLSDILVYGTGYPA